MKRGFQILALCFAAIFFVGCQNQQSEGPKWQGIKITDLAPLQSNNDNGWQGLETINFDVYILHLPVENMAVLDGIRQKAGAKRIRFKNEQAFAANGFSAGYSQFERWDPITELLRGGNAKNSAVVSLLLQDGQSEYVDVMKLRRKQDVFYLPADGPIKSVKVGPGDVGFLVKAQSVPGVRGVCHLMICPVVRPAGRGFVFSSLGIDVKTGAGDFVLLAPQKEISDKVTIGGLLFGSERREPGVRVFLILCTRIID